MNPFRLIVIAFLFSTTWSHAEVEKQVPEYRIVSDTVDPLISILEAEYVFDFSNVAVSLETQIVFSIDDEANLNFDLTESKILRIRLNAGTHSFAFYLDSEHEEIEILGLEIEEQHRKTLLMHFNAVRRPALMKKPVIYLYPTERTEVTVELDVVGNHLFTYPPIENGWTFACDPDGTLTKENRTFPYLFWEAEQEIQPEIISLQEGAILPGSEAVNYLEKQLIAFGMTSQERQDFITFWGPQLQTKTNLYIYLVFNEACDAFASLKISPEPDLVARVYMIWFEVSPSYALDGLQPQTIPAMRRDGFTVLEWGGAEINESQLLNKDITLTQ